MKIRLQFLGIENKIKRMSLEWLLVFIWIFLFPISIPLTVAFRVGQLYERRKFESKQPKLKKSFLLTTDKKEKDNILTEVRF